VKLVGIFGISKLKFPSSFRKRQELQKKSEKNGNFYIKTIFEKFDFIF